MKALQFEQAVESILRRDKRYDPLAYVFLKEALDFTLKRAADAGRARRFLNVYLDSAERVTREYARTHRQLRNRPLEENFRTLLIELEGSVEEQRRRRRRLCRCRFQRRRRH